MAARYNKQIGRYACKSSTLCVTCLWGREGYDMQKELGGSNIECAYRRLTWQNDMQFEIEDVASLTCGIRLMAGAGQIESSFIR